MERLGKGPRDISKFSLLGSAPNSEQGLPRIVNTITPHGEQLRFISISSPTVEEGTQP